MPKLKIKLVVSKLSPHYQMWCPACATLHEVNSGWTFNGDMEKPTFSPSILVTWSDHEGNKIKGKRCHSFLRDGIWQFLSDCTHDKAGMNVAMVDLPDWLAKE
jgi:hypothetical protein